MVIRAFDLDFTVCKVADASCIDLSRPFCFVARTDEELSLVCPTTDVPSFTIAREDGWKAFRIEGVLDFTLVGILARIASILAKNGIAIFAVSTYNTDYLLLKADRFQRAFDVLEKAGYRIVR